MRKWVIVAVVAVLLAAGGYRGWKALRVASSSKVALATPSGAPSVPDKIPVDEVRRARPPKREKPSGGPAEYQQTERPRNGRRVVRLGTYRFAVPQDWFLTRTASPRELAFGARDGRLGVHVFEVPASEVDAFVRRRDACPLPGMTVRFDPALEGTMTVNGLRVSMCGGTVTYGNGRHYGARFWLIRGRTSSLAVNAFDGVDRHLRALEALIRSVCVAPPVARRARSSRGSAQGIHVGA